MASTASGLMRRSSGGTLLQPGRNTARRWRRGCSWRRDPSAQRPQDGDEFPMTTRCRAGARSPQGLQPWLRTRSVRAALSIEEDERSTAIRAIVSGQAWRSSRSRPRPARSHARSSFFRVSQTPDGPPHRPGMTRISVLSAAGPGTRPRQVIVGLDHVLERGLGLIPYHGPGPAPHRPGLQPPSVWGSPPAIHARASDREPSCDYLARRPSSSAAATTRRRRSPG